MLTEQQAINIYHIKLRHLEDQKCKFSLRGMSGPVSKTYGVSARTIRDIWNRKTWTFATDQDSTTASVTPAIQADIQFRKLMCNADFGVCRSQERSGAQKEPATASLAAERSLSPENKSTACQRNFSISHPLKPLKRAAMELRMPAYLLAFMRIVFYKLCPQVLRNRLEHLSLKAAGWSGWRPRC